jgi:hypothetical protein
MSTCTFSQQVCFILAGTGKLVSFQIAYKCCTRNFIGTTRAHRCQEASSHCLGAELVWIVVQFCLDLRLPDLDVFLVKAVKVGMVQHVFGGDALLGIVEQGHFDEFHAFVVEILRQKSGIG